MFVHVGLSRHRQTPPLLTAALLSTALCTKAFRLFSSYSTYRTISDYRFALLIIVTLSMGPQIANCEAKVTGSDSHISTTITPTLDLTASEQTTANHIPSQNYTCTSGGREPNETVCATLAHAGTDRLSAASDSSCQLDEYFDYFERLLFKYACEDRRAIQPDESELGHENNLFRYSQRTNCSYCLDTYRQWLCSLDRVYQLANGSKVEPCSSRICSTVRRACPYIHPLEADTMYSSEPGFLCNVQDPDPSLCYYFSDVANSTSDECADSTAASICIHVSGAARPYRRIYDSMLVFSLIVNYLLAS